MPTYAYQAVDGSGKRLRGQAQAVSSGALARTLEERGLLVLDVAESGDAGGGGGRAFRGGWRERVDRGDTLSSALAKHPRLFSPLYVGLVRAGERSGDIDGAFARLAE